MESYFDDPDHSEENRPPGDVDPASHCAEYSKEQGIRFGE